MHDALHHAREVARHWREAKGAGSPGGVVIVLDGLFVGHAADLPPAAQWAAGCLAVAGDGQTHLARPTDFRGGLEWADLGTPEPSAESSAAEIPEDPLPS